LPARHQKRVVEFGEWLCGSVVKAVPARIITLVQHWDIAIYCPFYRMQRKRVFGESIRR
jgi:hypothetical protein